MSGETEQYEVAFVGICGSDLQKIRSGQVKDAHTLGHEITVRTGDRFAIANPMITCNVCDQCNHTDRDMFCRSLVALGRNAPGGLTGNIQVPNENIVEITNAAPHLGVLGDPLAVVIHGLQIANEAARNSRSAVILGDGIIAQLSALSLMTTFPNIEICQVITNHRGRVRPLQNFLDSVPTQNSSAAIAGTAESLADCDVDLVVEAVGRSQAETLNTAARIITPRGSILGFGVFPIGYHAPISIRELMYKEAKLIGSNSYNKSDLLAASKLLSTYPEILSQVTHDPIDVSNLQSAINLASSSNKHELPKKVIVRL